MAADEVDVLVIGAGPAGLAAGTASSALGRTTLVVDRGPDIDNRTDGEGTEGLGGAGLYSDGKFSFYPSATELWKLQPRTRLVEAYSWFANLIQRFGLQPEEFPSEYPAASKPSGSGPSMLVKKYPSYYMPFVQRRALTLALADNLGDSFQPLTDLKAVSQTADGFLAQIESSLVQRRVLAKSVVVSTGRFGPIEWPQIFSPAVMTFLRLEVGLRIEQPAKQFFLEGDKSLDPKILIRPQSRKFEEWRTFCCCRDGFVMTTRTGGLTTVSGNGDCEPTGFSNVGFNLRVSEQHLGTQLWRPLIERISKNKEPVSETYGTFTDSQREPSLLRQLYGPEIGESLQLGLGALSAELNISLDGATLHGPTLEGVCSYPNVDRHLRGSSHRLFVAGDAIGRFRGLTAALVSGYLAGIGAADALRGPR